MTLCIRQNRYQALYPKIYTDGSGTNNGKGCAIKIYLSDHETKDFKFQLDKENSVFQSEMFAILQAINVSTHHHFPRTHMYTDCLSAMHALANPNNRSPLAQKILRKSSNAQGQHFFIIWIKAHVGHNGKEEADILAKEATQGINAKKISILCPSSHLKLKLQITTKDLWQQWWDGANTGRGVYNLFPKVDSPPIHLSRHITWFITGHGPFPTYLYARNLSSSDSCACGEKGHPEHYLFSCPFTDSIHLNNNVMYHSKFM
ncbi:uncharacterized protein LOC118188554 [Stegodyphus dumicola]|uniref:uncharacterized protein LOC118188554 n=1 Tax=Stegodyphus dumicola TaxID=202533 RepID=UPI0015B153FF|nr:uncharacterized protein LOC118188554 [Stegodyphus dumicola]